MKKHIFIILLTLCLAITAMTVMTMAADTYGPFTYTISNGVVTITSCGDSVGSKEATIPSTIEGYPVTVIGDNAFGSSTEAVVIPASITTIGENAFQGSDVLTDVYYAGNESAWNSITIGSGNENLTNAFIHYGRSAVFDYTWETAFTWSEDLSECTVKITCNGCYSTKEISCDISADTTAYATCTTTGSITYTATVTFNNETYTDTRTVTTPTTEHTYVNGVCSVCNAVEPDYIYVGSLKLHDGYYTTDGSTETSGAPGSTVTSYAYYSSGVLYLNGFAMDCVNWDTAIQSSGDLEIVLTGDNSLTTYHRAIYVDGNLSMSGNGSLGISDVIAPIYATGDITISGCTVNANASHDGETVYAVYAGGDITVDTAATLTVTATSHDGEVIAIYANGDIAIANSTVAVTATCELYDYYYKNAYGISAVGDVLITGDATTGSKVNISVTGYNAYGVYSTGDIEITNSEAEIDSTGVSVTTMLIGTSGGNTENNLLISGSKVTATAKSDSTGGEVITIAAATVTISDDSEVEATAIFTGDYGIAIAFTPCNLNIIESKVTATASGINAIAYAGENLTITDSTVIATASGTYSYGIYAYEEDISITGETTTVTVSATGDIAYGIYSGGDTIISDGSVIATATGESYAYGIYAYTDVSISGSDVTATATASGTGSEASAIFAYGGSIDITESEVVAEASAYKIDGAILTYSADKDITITDSNVTATSTSGVYRDNGGAIATYDTGSDIIISGSKITATSISNSTTRKNFGAISAMGSVNVSESELELESTGGYVYGALHAEENIVVSASELDATADGIEAYVIVAIEGDIEISGSNVSATATGTSVQSAIYVTSGDIAITDSAVVADGGIDTDTGSVNIYAVDYAWDIKAGTSSASSTTKVYLGTNGSLKASADAWDESWSAYDYISITKSTHVHSYTSSVTTEATCTNDGVMTYTCTCGDSYAEVIPATGHAYEISYFTWADGYKSATATFKCANCSDEQTVNATVSVENYYGMYVYVATARYGTNGGTYSSVKTSGTVDMSGLETNSTSEVITEEVETTEPVEGTDTETEEEDAEPEANPTTGIVAAMLPMAVALAAVVVGKKK